MKKLAEVIEVIEVESEGLIGLMGERVTLMCMNYFYAGTLGGVNDTCVLLTNPSIVYQTGSWSEKNYEDEQSLPSDLYVQISSIEAFGRLK